MNVYVFYPIFIVMRADHFLQLSKTYRYVMKYYIFKYGILFLFTLFYIRGVKVKQQIVENSISVFRPSVSIASASTPVCPVLLALSLTHPISILTMSQHQHAPR